MAFPITQILVRKLQFAEAPTKNIAERGTELHIERKQVN